ADTPPWNRPLLATPRPGCEVEESSAGAARRPGPTMAHRAYCRALEARVAVLETHARRLEWQHQAADDLVVQHIMRTQDLEAGARDDTLEDTGLPIPLSTPSTSRRAGIPEAGTPPWNRPLLATPRPGCECQATDDFAVQHIMRTQALEAGARDDTLEDTDSNS
nr:hypothetical protein [Tanacetum cinerariifolium]